MLWRKFIALFTIDYLLAILLFSVEDTIQIDNDSTYDFMMTITVCRLVVLLSIMKYVWIPSYNLNVAFYCFTIARKGNESLLYLHFLIFKIVLCWDWLKSKITKYRAQLRLCRLAFRAPKLTFNMLKYSMIWIDHDSCRALHSIILKLKQPKLKLTNLRKPRHDIKNVSWVIACEFYE